MVKKEKTDSMPPKQETSQEIPNIEGMFNQILQKFKDYDDRFEELERNQDGTGKTKLFVAGQAFDPDRKHLSEMSVIKGSAIEPFTLAYVLGSVLDDDVLEGKASLGDKYMDESKRLFRGRGGKLLDLAAQQAREEAQTQGEGMGTDDAHIKGI